MRRWATSNDIFHRTILDAAGLSTLQKVHAFMAKMPLVAPVAILFTNDRHDDALARMADAHSDHVHILNAVSRGQSARAEDLMREHIHRSRDHLSRLLTSGRAAVSPEPATPRRRKKQNDVA
jgi:GntR family transcriptional regulator of vanillate catabolism